MAFGNISSYVAAGQSANSAGAQLFAAQRSRSNPDQILKAAMQARAEEKLNVMKIESELAQTAVKATGKAANQAITSEANMRVSAIKGKTQAMAGKVAMLGETAKMFKNDRRRPKAPVNVDYSELLTDANKRVTDAQDKITNFKPTTMDTPPAQVSQAPDSTQPSGISMPKTGGSFNRAQLQSLMESTGMSPKNSRIMSAIGMGESGGSPTIDTVQSGLDPNRRNEFSVGLFQINTQAHGNKLSRRGWTAEDLRDPVKNAQIAKEVYEEAGGFGPWSVYTSGKYTQYLN